MIKIKLIESGFHTLFPYKKSMNQFRDIGVEIVLPENDTDSYDLVLIDHHSFCDKKLSLKESTEKGLEFLSKITGDYILVDGQDSASLIGTFEVFKESNALLMLKDTLYKDRSLYTKGWIGGRYFWGTDWENFDELKYIPKDFDKYSDRIKLSGKNWLGVNPVQWLDYSNLPKLFDVSAMFGYPIGQKTYEHMLDGKTFAPRQDYYYDEHRKPVMDIVNQSPYMVAKLFKGRRLPFEIYNQYNLHSKVVLNPFGFGELAPRDIETAMYGSILLKPDVSHLETHPFIYEDGVTYIACKHDYSDLEEKIEYCVENFDELQETLVGNMRKKYEEAYHPHYLPIHTAKILTELNLVESL